VSKFIPVAISCYDLSDINWCQFVIVEVEDAVDNNEFRKQCRNIAASEVLDPELPAYDENDMDYTVFTVGSLQRIKESLAQRIAGIITVTAAEGIAYIAS